MCIATSTCKLSFQLTFISYLFFLCFVCIYISLQQITVEKIKLDKLKIDQGKLNQTKKTNLKTQPIQIKLNTTKLDYNRN